MSKCRICGKWFVTGEEKIPHNDGYAHSHHFPLLSPSSSSSPPNSAPRPSPGEVTSEAPNPPQPPSSQLISSWQCFICSESNFASSLGCKSCGFRKDFRFPQEEHNGVSWNCRICTYSGNHWNSMLCEICSSSRGYRPELPPLPDVKNPDDYLCIVCYTEPRNHLFLPCCHLITCSQCIENGKISCGTKCPICRTIISEIKQVYLA